VNSFIISRRLHLQLLGRVQYPMPDFAAGHVALDDYVAEIQSDTQDDRAVFR
jgi:hypothetical protein